jgi:large subunit ribosomal protein L13
MKTYTAKPESVKRDWYVIDASGKVLGRVATEIARRLRGKHKPEYTPHVDTGDYIVVINAGQIEVTGNKTTDKFYHTYSGYQSGLKSISFRDLRNKAPERIIEIAVRGMLPKGPLGRAMLRKLKVYPGATHSHSAQQPKTLEI